MSNNENNSTFKEYFLPVSILIAAVLIAGAVIISASSSNQTANTKNTLPENASAKNIAEVTESDWIRGSIDAPIKIIEFSDFECPFCQQFHGTMKKVMDEYGDQVAWVYRQYPVKSLHSKAPDESEASECVGALGGDEAFWNFADKIFEVSPSNNGLDLSKLPDYAEEAGVDRQKFNECMESDKYVKNVEEDMEDGTNAGAKGTPYSVIVTENGDYSAIPGALPFESENPNRPSMKSIIDSVISNL